MDKTTTVKWVVTSALKLLAGYVAIRCGQNAVSADTWTAIGEGLVAAILAGAAIWHSVRDRKEIQQSVSAK